MDIDSTTDLPEEEGETPIDKLDNFMSAEEEEEDHHAVSDDVAAGLDEDQDEMEETNRVEGVQGGADEDVDAEPMSSIRQTRSMGKKAKVGTGPLAAGMSR